MAWIKVACSEIYTYGMSVFSYVCTFECGYIKLMYVFMCVHCRCATITLLLMNEYLFVFTPELLHASGELFPFASPAIPHFLRFPNHIPGAIRLPLKFSRLLFALGLPFSFIVKFFRLLMQITCIVCVVWYFLCCSWRCWYQYLSCVRPISVALQSRQHFSSDLVTPTIVKNITFSSGFHMINKLPAECAWADCDRLPQWFVCDMFDDRKPVDYRWHRERWSQRWCSCFCDFASPPAEVHTMKNKTINLRLNSTEKNNFFL